MNDADRSKEGWSTACLGCGARLVYAPGTLSLTCPYCDREQSIENAHPGEIEEYDLSDALSGHARTRVGDLIPGGRAVTCSNCSATTVFDHQADRCPYCDAPVVADEAAGNESVFVPESVLPFGLDRESAKDAFRAWVRKRWFAPSDLWKRARTETIDGVYLPYWTFDSETTTRYHGQRGEHYWVAQQYTDSQGRRQTRRVRRTRWYPASGVVQVSFDDVLVCATRSLPDALIYRLEPWDLAELRHYDAAYLSGFVAERYRVDLKQGFDIADGRMRPRIQSSIHSDIGGDEQRIRSMDVNHAHVHFKHILLPLWISSFRYRRKVFRFIVNARTGEVAGERPWSWIKIALAAITVLVVVGVGAVLSQR